jgi:hypothetical protein
MTTTQKRRRKAAPKSEHARLDAQPLGDFPPREILLFRRGMTSTTKGDFLFDEKAAQSVMAAFQQHGIDLAMDFDHGALATPNGRKRDVPGYFKPEVRADGLYAVPQWTAAGLAAIRPGPNGELPEYRYTSPSFDYDPETRRVLRLGPLAITSYPATHRAKPLVLSDSDRRTTLSLSFEDIADAIARAVSAIVGPVDLDEVYDSHAIVEQPMADGEERCLRVDYRLEGDSVIVDLITEVEEVYQPVEGGIVIRPPNAPPMVGEEQPAAVPQEPDMSAPVEDAAQAAVASLTASITTTTGTKSAAEALAVVEAWRRDSADLATLRARIAAEEAAREQAARSAELDACVAEGKLSPAERSADGQPECWLTSLDARGVARFRAARSPVVSVAPSTPTPTTTTASLSAEDAETITVLSRAFGLNADAITNSLTKDL